MPRSEIGLIRGYGDQNLKRAEELEGVVAVRVESSGEVYLRGENMAALQPLKRGCPRLDARL